MSDKHMAGYKEHIEGLNKKSSKIVETINNLTTKHTDNDCDYQILMSNVVEGLKGKQNER